MVQKDELHELVMSLSQAEKRYVKVFAGRHVIGEENNYVQLFDIIASLEVYDEARVVRLVDDPKRARHLPSEKHYLRKLILRAMRAYNDERDVNAILRNLVADLQFLKARQQYSLFEKTWKKAWKLATLHERFPTMLYLLQERREVLKETDPPHLLDSILALTSERKAVLARAAQLSDYLELYDHHFLLVRRAFRQRGPKLQEMLQGLEANPLYATPIPPQAFIARLDYFSIHAFVAQLKGHAEDAQRYFQAVCAEWEKSPHEIQDDHVGYLRSLGNYLAACHAADAYDGFPDILARVQAIPAVSPRAKAEKFYTLAHFELIWRLNTGRLQETIPLARDIEAGLAESGDRLGQFRRLIICYNMAITHFFQGDFSTALRWLNRIINEQDTDSRQDIRQAARLLLLLVHIELRNLDLIAYLLRSVQRYLRKREQIFDVEKAVLDFINATMSLPAGMRPTQAAGELAGRLEALKGTPQGAVAGLDEVLYWARSCMQARPIQEVYQEAIRGPSGEAATAPPSPHTPSP